MTKKVILHIGVHKTGSTSVQAWAIANASALKRAGVYYPEMGRNPDGNHSELAWSVADDPRSSVKVFQQMLEEIEQSDQPVVFISGEEFEYLQPHSIASLKSALEAFDVRIVLSLRPQHEIIRSQYGEWIRQFLTVDDFSVFWRFHMRLPEYDFVTLWKNWSAAFGADNILLVSHTEACTYPHGMVSSIMDVMNLPAGDFEFLDNTNKSDPAEVVYLWRYMLLKLQLVTGRRFGIHDRSAWTGKHAQLDTLRRKYGSIIGATRRMYMNGGYKTTRFEGYSDQELSEVQTHFADINTEMFRIAGRQLWETVSKEDDPVALTTVPLHAVRKADTLFVDIVQSAKAKS